MMDNLGRGETSATQGKLGMLAQGGGVGAAKEKKTKQPGVCRW
jgi:hypothetical protein